MAKNIINKKMDYSYLIKYVNQVSPSEFEEIRYFPNLSKPSLFKFESLGIREKETIVSKIRKCVTTSQKTKKETSFEVAIKYGKIMSSKMFSGEQNQVIRYRSIYSRPQNYFFPYEAILFDFHTHKENPFPSQTDLRGSCLQTIQHKKSEVNPLYSIGRCKDDTIELLCYRFEKEMLPSLQKKEEIKECLDYFDMLASDAMYPMKNISPKKAMQTDISFFAEVLNEVPLLNAFAITIPLKSPKPLNIVSK